MTSPLPLRALPVLATLLLGGLLPGCGSPPDPVVDRVREELGARGATFITCAQFGVGIHDALERTASGSAVTTTSLLIDHPPVGRSAFVERSLGAAGLVKQDATFWRSPQTRYRLPVHIPDTETFFVYAEPGEQETFYVVFDEDAPIRLDALCITRIHVPGGFRPAEHLLG
ncbi:hypothetical protein F8S09_03535 [Deinococcus sp. SDU3-2]|uniref:Uncharacterized protein n=1 Tax=Deinococcus terrestris TaxID=2651870 RepID=A0A7X1TQK0_9DEIO|nr:hypothetical protein [Deinococcus terrestris]MPY65770.1 hypothetical protein [Deinococcus terrestris]